MWATYLATSKGSPGRHTYAGRDGSTDASQVAIVHWHPYIAQHGVLTLKGQKNAIETAFDMVFRGYTDELAAETKEKAQNAKNAKSKITRPLGRRSQSIAQEAGSSKAAHLRAEKPTSDHSNLRKAHRCPRRIDQRRRQNSTTPHLARIHKHSSWR